MPPLHTPGDWQLGTTHVCGPGLLCIHTDDEAIAVLVSGVEGAGLQPTPKQLANAELIADAPKLLRALESMVRNRHRTRHECDMDSYPDGTSVCPYCQAIETAQALLRKHGYGPEPDALEQERSNATNHRSADE